MANRGTGYFDRRGQFFKTAIAATESDLAAMLGQIGDGESLAPGIAHTLMEKRAEIEHLFAEHDVMLAEEGEASDSKVVSMKSKRPEFHNREASQA
ncbi:MAG: hypothetical protein AAF697_05960 [Pseudomonadota bacterium]